MIHLLLLLSSLVQAQDISSNTLSVVDEVKISNLGKDTRSLLSGRYTQTGKPTFKNGFCFGDGSCQTTLPVSSINNSDGLGMNLFGLTMWAKSIDGASQSSGCVVAAGMVNGSVGNVMQFTSTTSAALDFNIGGHTPAVLLETCAPGAFCRLGVFGIYRVYSTNVGIDYSSSQFPQTAATRCQVAASGANPDAGTIIGRALSDVTGTPGVMFLKMGL